MATLLYGGRIGDADLVESLARKQYELVQERFAHSMSRLENTASRRGIRRDIARVKTILVERAKQTASASE